MPKQLIFENTFVSLWYYQETNIVHHQIRQPVHGEMFRELLTRGRELFLKHDARKWLSDDHGNEPLTPEDVQWSETEWVLPMLASKWKYWAVVLPEKMSGQLDMQKKGIERHVHEGIQVSIFENADEALAWLESVQ